MNKVLDKLREIVAMLFSINKELHELRAGQARLEAEQKRQAAVLDQHTAILQEIRDAVVVEEAVTLDLQAGPAEEQP